MTLIVDVANFVGMAPGTAVRKLPNEYAADAQTIRIQSGNLEAWKGQEAVSATLAGGIVRALFLYDNTHWFSRNVVTNFIGSPAAQDPFDRVYFTEAGGYPKVTSNLIATGSDPKPAASYRLGVPAPDTAITASVNEDAGADPENFSDDETRFYVMTFVTEYGEEGPPGPVSAAVELGSPSTESVDLTLPGLASNPYNVNRKRIYRTITTGDGTDYFLVAEVSLASNSYTDAIGPVEGDILPNGVGKALDTVDFDLPPETMQGLVMGINGMAAGFAGNEIAISAAYLPHAWPLDYRRATEHEIVGIVPTSVGFVVGTKGYPYVLSGIAPDSMSSEKLDTMQACLSGGSMVDMGEYALYASPNGLVAATSGRAELITEKIITRREWEQYQPETIHAYRYQDKYIAFYGDAAGDGSGVGGFVYDPATNTLFNLDFYATAGFNDIETDKLYLVIDGDLIEWDADDENLQSYSWKSKLFKGPSVAPSCMKVYTESPADVSVKLWADGQLVLDVAALTNEAFRLPSVRASEWQFAIAGTASVQRVSIATKMSDFE